jgi:hypothetical protein
MTVRRRGGHQVRQVEPVDVPRVGEDAGVHGAEEPHRQSRGRFDFHVRQLGDLRLQHLGRRRRGRWRDAAGNGLQHLDFGAQLLDVGPQRRELAGRVGLRLGDDGRRVDRTPRHGRRHRQCSQQG